MYFNSQPGPSVTITIPPPPDQDVTPEAHRSKCLIGFGITELVFSFMLLLWSIWTCSLDNSLIAPYIGITCSVLHLIVAILAIVGGCNGIRYRGVVITCLVLGIIGASTIAVASANLSAIGWITHDYSCNYCRTSDRNCPESCTVTKSIVIFLPLLIITLLVAIVGIIITSISCCNVCYCCGCCFTGTKPVKAYIVYQPAPAHQFSPMYQPYQPPPAYTASNKDDEASTQKSMVPL